MGWILQIENLKETEDLNNILGQMGTCLVTQLVKNLPAMQETQFDPWVSKIPGGGNGSPLQYSCLENPRDGGASWAAINGVAQSRTRLK